MSLTLCHNSNRPNVNGRGPQEHLAKSRPGATIGKKLGRLIASAARLMVGISDAIAEARLQKALIEAELYRNRYRHTSKNDDDLPVVR